ncbi:copper chaperone PCu(A)C [Kozakia baliensis]|uniref:Uncharacterized protein n=1 Tax=Kozakia baliensis TaxID=153496 RepID=A0A1D8UTM9_9PROT|nr:copper chaperone PCu(A)C [Kozakia baliensis]AOX16979.1 hypothetical protein A0U89_07310 [Kozakia baliensis]GBR25362.1 hypothetical protein AA0488_0625 [Kozakia baliensis NRIC 0488]GEL63966.1 hypothetical protein KBA01_12520 [Kozakia baliensis]
MKVAQGFLLSVLAFGIVGSGVAYSATELTLDDNVPGQANAAKDISVMGWMRRSEHIGDAANVFFTITNNSRDAHLITGVSSPDCRSIVAHHSEQESTSHTADLLSHFALPPKIPLVFPVGGYHLVCQGMSSDVAVGTKVPLTFTFLGGTSLTVQFEVRQTPPSTSP